ncbi:MAG: phospholipase D family protein [Thermodesulfovibrionales bacterium]|nr:phospholipase D family protein [Thermodesulfovibrionales bacterium]
MNGYGLHFHGIHSNRFIYAVTSCARECIYLGGGQGDFAGWGCDWCLSPNSLLDIFLFRNVLKLDYTVIRHGGARGVYQLNKSTVKTARGKAAGIRRRGMAFAFIFILLAGCASIPKGYMPPEISARPAPGNSALKALFPSPEGANIHESGVYLLNDPKEAFLSRLALFDLAENSIDVQSYMWKNDRSGRVLAEHLLQAADRGVRVRILLDDIHTAKSDFPFAAFGAHPNMQIRLYNPFRSRELPRIFRHLEFVTDLSRLNQRMHNKVIIADNTSVIIGGRNISDAYFGVNDTFNFKDLDVLATGPVVKDVSDAFDLYWNSRRSVQTSLFRKYRVSERRTRKLHMKNHQYVNGLKDIPYEFKTFNRRGLLATLASAMTWAQADLIYDKPLNNNGEIMNVAVNLREMNESAEEELIISSPYMVPDTSMISRIRALTDKGVDVRILTNSLGTTDVTIAYAGYAKHRKSFLLAGAELFEFKYKKVRGPWQDKSFHSKAAIVDRELVYIGSYNFDQRSMYINTDIGLIIRSPMFANKVASVLDTDMAPVNSWKLAFRDTCIDKQDDKCAITWRNTVNGVETIHYTEPDIGILKRLKYIFLKVLRIDKHL